MSLPARPSSPALVRDPLLYCFGTAPDTINASFQHVIAIVDRWLAGSDDPVPDPEPPPPPCPKPPDPNPPPVPAFPLLELLDGLAAMDAATMAPAWSAVRAEVADWMTEGPFGWW